MQTDHRSGRTILAILVLPVLTVAFLWIPFGFSLGGLVEEWGFLELFARKGVFYIITDATLQAQKARPLHVLPQALAYTLDPDSFLFWHIIQAAALTVKAVSAAVIGLYLTKNRALAAFLGLLDSPLSRRHDATELPSSQRQLRCRPRSTRNRVGHNGVAS